jgi:hypothetical protein
MKDHTRSKTWSRREPRVAALILYEDKPTGLRAKLILDSILDQLGIAAWRTAELWRLDLLGRPVFRKRAASAAANADLIFLSLHGNRQVAAEIIDWSYLWLHRRRKSSQALAIILDKAQRGTPIVDEILHAFSFAAYSPGLDVYRSFQDVPHVAEDCARISLRTGNPGIRPSAAPLRTMLHVARRTMA